MKTFLSLSICLAGSTLFGANTAFEDFNTNQFGTANRKVVIKSGANITNVNLVGDATIPAGGSLTIGTTNIIAELAGKGSGSGSGSFTNSAFYGYPTGDASMLTNKEPVALRSFYMGMGNSLQKTTNQSVIMWIGDSWAAGWSDQLREKYRQQLGYGGDGFWAITTNSGTFGGGSFPVYSASGVVDTGVGFGITGVWTNDVAGSGPSLITATTHDLTAGINWTSRVTRFSIVYKVQTGGGKFSYSQDGAGAVVVDTAGSSGLFTNVFTPSLTYGLHTLVIAITDVGTTGVVIAGIDLQNEGYGPRLHHFGVGGTASTNWVNVDSNVWVSALRTINPDTVFVSLGGVNDKTYNVPIATYRSNMDLIEKRIKAALPAADIIFVSQAETFATATLHTVSDYLAVQREIALTNRHDFINNYDLFGTFSVSTNMGLWGDTIHPSIIGNKSLFRRLNTFLGDGGITFGNQVIHPVYNHQASHSEINVGGDTNNFWIRTDRTSGALGLLPLQVITGGGGATKTNITFLTDGTTTIPSLNGSIGIGVNPPTAFLDTRGNFKFIGSRGSATTFGDIQATDLASGNAVLSLSGNNSVSGNVIGLQSSATASGILYHQIRNIGTGSALQLIWGSATGDAYLRFQTTNDWAMGSDISDGGKFKISYSTVLGTSDSFKIDENKLVNMFGPVNVTGALGATASLVHLQGTDVATGDNMLTLAGNAVTGTVIGLNASLSCSTLFYHLFRNAGVGDSLLLVQAGSAGDAYQRFQGPVVTWAMGNDVSDATKFKVSFGNTLGTTDRLTITTNGNATIAGSLAIGGGAALLKVLTNTGVLDFPSTSTLTDSDLTITVTGAALGDPVVLGVPNGSTLAGGSYSAWVSAADTVKVRFANHSAGSLDPASGTFRVQVNQF